MKPTAGELALGVIGLALMATGIYGHGRVTTRPHDSTTSQAPAAANTATTSSGTTPTFAIVDARVFDGRDVLERATVLVEKGRIAGVGPDLRVPAGVQVVSGFGKTLLPGLIDAHVHAYDDALQRGLVFGVTTEIDMFTDARFAASQRAEQQKGLVATRADLVSAGTLATAPKGHGTEYGIVIPTLTKPGEARAFVDARIAEGSDFIKIIDDDAASYGLHVPTLDSATIRALIEAAHARHKLAVVHVSTVAAARDVIAAGADGLAHIPADAAADPELVALLQRTHAFVIPTLSVVASTAGDRESVESLAADAALRPFISDSERRTLNASFPSTLLVRGGLARATALTRSLIPAGVRLLAGTDAPNPGTAHGVSLHGELELLVRAGLTPTAALAAATSEPAAVFGLADRGRIAPGLRADLLLVDGDATRDVRTTRRIAMVWKGGVAVARGTATTQVAAKVETNGLVSDFEGNLDVGFGAGWQISTDSMLGGSSEATMRIVPDGANGSRGSLEIRGHMKPGAMFPWAGPMFMAGATPMAPVDLSRFSGVSFWTKGDGGTYQVMLFASSLGRIPAVRTFVAGSDWKQVVIPFSAFGRGIDGNGLQALLISGGAGQADFRLQVDEVRFK